jgi:hypothetical protein
MPRAICAFTTSLKGNTQYILSHFYDYAQAQCSEGGVGVGEFFYGVLRFLY